MSQILENHMVLGDYYAEGPIRCDICDGYKGKVTITYPGEKYDQNYCDVCAPRCTSCDEPAEPSCEDVCIVHQVEWLNDTAIEAFGAGDLDGYLTAMAGITHWCEVYGDGDMRRAM